MSAGRHTRKRDEIRRDYPPGFTAWASWLIDLSTNAPPLDKQFDALLPTWERLPADHPAKVPAEEPSR